MSIAFYKVFKFLFALIATALSVALSGGACLICFLLEPWRFSRVRLMRGSGYPLHLYTLFLLVLSLRPIWYNGGGGDTIGYKGYTTA